jgi:hypothetical protein
MIEMQAQTMPFASEFERDIHFSKHGHKFGAADPTAYEKMADAFMFGAMTLTMRECLQPARVNRLRYNSFNRHFGVALAAPPEYVKTFHPVPHHEIQHRGGATQYFDYECNRIDL